MFFNSLFNPFSKSTLLTIDLIKDVLISDTFAFSNLSVTIPATSFASVLSHPASRTRASTIVVSSYSCLSVLVADSTIRAISNALFSLFSFITFTLYNPLRIFLKCLSFVRNVSFSFVNLHIKLLVICNVTSQISLLQILKYLCPPKLFFTINILTQ